MTAQANTAALQTKIDRARWYLLRSSPFWGALAMALRDEITPLAGPTACTDGKRIRWNPGFLAKLTEPETRFVLAHETAHCALGHFWRLPIGEEASQMAADYKVNQTLSESNLEVTMPNGGLRDTRWDGFAEEQILAELRKQQQQTPKGQKGQAGQGQSGQSESGTPDPGGCGSFEQPDTGDDESAADAAKALREDWQRHVIAAVQSAEAACGNVPGEFATVAERATALAKVDWKTELADFAQTAIGTRNDWSRAARRHAWQPVIYPRRRPDMLTSLCVVRDSSGSTYSVLPQFNAQVRDLAAELNCRIRLMDCDTSIARDDVIEPGQDIPDEILGGGGTDLRPPFERCRELIDSGEDIAGLVYLTDLYGPEPEFVGFPVLWVCTSGRTAKTGRTVQIDA